MALIYEPFQSTMADKNGEKLYYPRVVRTATVTTAQIAKEVAQYSALSPGDVKSTIDNLVTVMTNHLHASESVNLEGLGIFRMVMKSKGKGVASAKEVSSNQATLNVRFQPSSTKNTDRTLATRALVTGVKCVRIDRVQQEAEDQAGSGNDGIPMDPSP